MANKKPKVVVRRKKESVRERAEKISAKASLKPRHRKVASAAARPVKGARSVLTREFHPIKMPDNKVGRHLSKRRSWIPGFFLSSWTELRQVTWLKPKQAVGLSVAVIVFSMLIAGFVRLLVLEILPFLMINAKFNIGFICGREIAFVMIVG